MKCAICSRDMIGIDPVLAHRTCVVAFNEGREDERRRMFEVLAAAPEAVMDTRVGLGVCALKEEDFPALQALKGKRVKLVVVNGEL